MRCTVVVALAGAVSSCGSLLESAEFHLHQAEVANAVEQFHTDFGEYPFELGDLVPGYVPSLHDSRDGLPAYLYNPETGYVQVVALIPPATLGAMKTADEQSVARIHDAIAAHREKRGTPPPSLEALVPDYLAELPVSAGADLEFFYSPATGSVWLDPDLQALYDSIEATEDRELADDEVRDDYEDNLNDEPSIQELTDGQGYPDPQQVLDDGRKIFGAHGDEISRTSETAGASDATEVNDDALDLYDQAEMDAMPSPQVVLDEAGEIFHDLYGTKVDRAISEPAETAYEEHTTEEGELDETQQPAAEAVLDAGRELFEAILNAGQEP